MRNKKFLPIGILLLGIGFATVTATLLITGNVKIATNDADFDVVFTKATSEEGATATIAPDGKSITFETKNLTTVGDIAKLDFEVTNNSELYDAEVSIECSATGEKSSYYSIYKEVVTPIAAKTTKAGKVEVTLSKAPIADIHEEFTCTLTATAAERTTKAKYTPKYYAFGDPTTSSTQDYTTLKYTGTETPAKVFVGLDANESQKSVCIVRNNKLECFKNNNVEYEQKHVREVFSDILCTEGSDSNISYVSCIAGDFHCYVYFDGYARCYDTAANLACRLSFDDIVTCY